MKKPKTFNLKKIILYCVIHNVEDWKDVPRCGNCRDWKNGTCPYKVVNFHCIHDDSSKILKHTFKLDSKEDISKITNRFVFDGCSNWRKNK
jgi:hypothetical protein